MIAFEKLQKHGKRFIQNVHDQAVHYLYWAHLGLWANGTDTDMSVTSTYFALPSPVEIIDIADNATFDGILGMDVLQLCDFRMDRGGHFEVRMA